MTVISLPESSSLKEITFLTTNYRNRLDPALIRPSRIDYIMSFKNITTEQIKSMFTRFFPNMIDKLEKFVNSLYVRAES